MRHFLVLSVVWLWGGSVSAQDFGIGSPAALALDEINWNLSRMRLDMEFPLSGGSGSLSDSYGGGFAVYQQVYPTRSQWKHYFRMQRAEAKRAKLAARRAAAKGGA